MQKKSLSLKSRKLKLDIEGKTKFFDSVTRGGWWIKFSTYRDHYILLMIISKYTGQTIIRYYAEEQDAVAFINFITTCNAQNTFHSV
jgi:hypothetical protein